jgi:hypothetical protein
MITKPDTHIVFSVLFMLALAIAQPAKAAEALAALNNVQPMNAGELAGSYGGFELGNGVQINVGIATDISINGALVSHSIISTGPQASANPAVAVTTQLQTVNGITQITQLPNGTGTIVNNTASNTTIQQLQTISIDVSNSSKLNMGAGRALLNLQTQANAMRTPFH